MAMRPLRVSHGFREFVLDQLAGVSDWRARAGSVAKTANAAKREARATERRPARTTKALRR